MALCLALEAATAQQPDQDVSEDEQMDRVLRQIGFVCGQAFQCHAKDQQTKLERVALDIATNVLRLFGSDRAFFFAAAFGAGATDKMDEKGCAEAIKQSHDMLNKFKVLAKR
jgi:hypothetical protein